MKRRNAGKASGILRPRWQKKFSARTFPLRVVQSSGHGGVENEFALAARRQQTRRGIADLDAPFVQKRNELLRRLGFETLGKFRVGESCQFQGG